MSDITDQLNARVAELSATYDRVKATATVDTGAAAKLAEQSAGLMTAITAIDALMLKINTDFPPT